MAWILLFSRARAQSENPIQVENARLGTNAWMITNYASNHQIEGYADLTSVNRGGQIRFYVNTVDSTYTLQVFRIGWYSGLGGRAETTPIERTGIKQPACPMDSTTGMTECAWSDPYTLTVSNPSDPTDWVSGFYLVLLTGSSGLQSYIVFVVRDDGYASGLLFQSSVTTYQAYNAWGGKSLYTFNSSQGVSAVKVSFNRPYDDGLGSGQFLSAELNAAAYLESQGYDLTYDTDVDTHASPSQLLIHKGFLSVGHDEYWSYEMRQNLTAARDAGVNLGFFAGDESYWQIRFESSPVSGAANRTEVCYKDLPANPSDPSEYQDPDAQNPATYQFITTAWRLPHVTLPGQPEEELIGEQDNGAEPVVTQAANEMESLSPAPDGVTTSFSGFLGHNDPQPGTVVLTDSNGVTFTDQGNGTLTSNQSGASGTLEYDVAFITLNYATPPPAGTTISGAYWFAGADIVITDASDPVFNGTGLSNGDHIQSLMGYETDSEQGNQPANKVRLAHSPYYLLPGTTGGGTGFGPTCGPSGQPCYGDMSVYQAASGATVFSVGSIYWSEGLANVSPWSPYPYSTVNSSAQQITNNVLAVFLSSGPSSTPSASPSTTASPTPTPSRTASPTTTPTVSATSSATATLSPSSTTTATPSPSPTPASAPVLHGVDSAANTSGSATSLSIPLPGAAQPGDLIVVQFAQVNNATVTIPGGWNKLREDTTADSGFRVTIAYHIQQSGDPSSVTFNLSAGSVVSAISLAYGNVNTSNPFDGSGANTYAITTTSSLIAPSITTTASGDQLMVLYSAFADNESFTTPAGTTARQTYISPSGGGAGSLVFLDQSLGAAGATGSRSTSLGVSTNEAIAQQIALRP